MANLSLPFADYYRYRSLRYVEGNIQRGCDVYALQTALVDFGAGLQVDGLFGKLTRQAVRDYQGMADLTVDGIAGIATQRELAKTIGEVEGRDAELPTGVPHGHIEHESSFMLGNYTRLYPNGTRDEGVVQRNTAYATSAEAFNVPGSIRVLCKRVHDYHAKYHGWGVEDPRAWRLACGSWNAPAWTDTLAKGGTLSASAYEHITTYINEVIAYADLGQA